MSDRTRRFVRWLIAVLCHYAGLDALHRKLRGPTLTILMFHRVRDDADPYPLSITPPSYRKIVTWLRRSGILIALDEGIANLASRDGGNSYAITFDDGYLDNLILLETPGGAPASVVYLATSHMGAEPILPYRLAEAIKYRRVNALDLTDLDLGIWTITDDQSTVGFLEAIGERLKYRPADELARLVARIRERLDPSPAGSGTNRDMLDWPDVARLHAAGVEIGAHTVHHTILSRVDVDVARAEIEQSRDDVTRNVQAPRHFAYPNGGVADFSERDVALIRDAGFATAVTTIEGVNRPGADPYRLHRYNIDEARFQSPLGSFSRALFFSETSGILAWLRSRRSA